LIAADLKNSSYKGGNKMSDDKVIEIGKEEMPKTKQIWIEVDGEMIRTDWTLNFASPTEVMAALMVAIDSVKNSAVPMVQQRPIQGRPPWVKRN
jgi:hypothetical protein